MPTNPLIPMELSGRDRAIVHLIARFRQASSAHVYELLFQGTTRAPCDRALKRLSEAGYLSRIERRMVGGTKGGSGQYVYQLGRRGFYMFNNGKYTPARTVSYHALGIIEAFIRLKRAEQEGRLLIEVFSCEPDCWAVVGGVELRPDMFAEVVLPSLERHKLWLEIDMATEGQKQIRGKLGAYWRAYNDADVGEWPIFPLCVWVAVDDERAKELRWMIDLEPVQSRGLYQVTTLDQLQTLF